MMISGISRPRVAADGTLLPNARRISETLFKNKHQDDRRASMMFPLWAEFVEHDMDYTVQSAGKHFKGPHSNNCDDS